MKRGRILSLFLSIVLLASVIIPCLQLSVNADAKGEIGKIKAAWEQWKQADATTAPEVPEELATTEDLLKAISIAEAAINNSAYADANNAELKTAVNGAWNFVKSDETLLTKAIQQAWAELTQVESTIFTMDGYNKSGLDSNKLKCSYDILPKQTTHPTYDLNDGVYSYYASQELIADGLGVNHPAHSGNITSLYSLSKNDDEVRDFGNTYLELTKEGKDVAGTEQGGYTEDKPSFTVGDTIVYVPNMDVTRIPAYGMRILSTKNVTLKCKVRYIGTGGGWAFADIFECNVKKDELTTFNIKKALDDYASTRTEETHKYVGTIREIMLFISDIDEPVENDDYIRFSTVLGNKLEQLPSNLSGDVSLAAIYNKASSLNLSKYLDGAAKERFQELVAAAKTLIRAGLSEKFKNKDELINAVTNEIWPSLSAKEPIDLGSFVSYNSSGDGSYGTYYTADGKEDKNSDKDFKEGINDAANSGNTVLLASDNTQKSDYGSSYVRLTTKKFEGDSQEANADRSNDIPYFDKGDLKHSVVVSSPSKSIIGLQNLKVNVKASMAMTIGCSVWFAGPREDGTGDYDWKSVSKNITIKADKVNTIDLMDFVNEVQVLAEKSYKAYEGKSDADKAKERVPAKQMTQIKHVAIGVRTLAEDPDSDDYFEIGNIRCVYDAALPEITDENGKVTAIKLYEAMQDLNLDKYFDGDSKDSFILAMEAVKMASDAEWEEIYKDQDALARAIKCELWPKLVEKATFKNPFRYYNTTGGSDDSLSFYYDKPSGDNAVPGTTSDKSGKFVGTGASEELKPIYGKYYYRLTNKKESDDKTLAAIDRDIPWLDESVAVITLGTGASELVDVHNSDSIFIYLNSSMDMSIRMRCWYYRTDPNKETGKYTEWGVGSINFDIKAGLNRIELKDLFIDGQFIDRMKEMHYSVLNPYNFEHPVTDNDFLEIGTIGDEAYAVVPKRLEKIDSLAAIVRAAKELDMDDYLGDLNDPNDTSSAKASKQMFVNALNRATELLNNLDVNLSEHVPVEVYETDASGKRTKLSEKQFGYDEQAKLYDGVIDSNPVEFDVKNKKLDIILNLNDKMALYDIRAYLLENNVKDMKIYTSPVRAGIWDESGLLYQYDGTTPSAKSLGIATSDPKVPVVQNQYVRLSFTEVTGDKLKLTEIKCMGKGIQQLAYTNLIEGKTDVMYYAEVDYKENKPMFLKFESNKYEYGDNLRYLNDPNTAHDGYLDTVVDFYGGSRTASKQTTYNLVFDLQGLSAVDNVKYYAASNPEYFPRHMKFYLGNDVKNILDNNNEATVCVAEFTEATKDENGLYEAKFLARNASHLRIEFIEDGEVGDDGRYGDCLLAVAQEIQINGLSLNASKSDAVKTFTDEESGIIVEILKLNDGDIFEDVQGMRLEKRKPTVAEVEKAGEFDFIFDDWFYTVTFLDYRGDPVTDVGGREIRVSVPLKDDDIMDSVYMATLDGDDVVLMDHNILENEDKFYIAVSFDDPTKIKFAKGAIGELEFEEEFEPEEEEEFFDEEDEEFEEDEYEEDEEEEEETSNGKRKKYYKVIKRGGGLSTGAIVGIVSGSVVAVTGGALMIIFRKKIFKPRIKKPKV